MSVRTPGAPFIKEEPEDDSVYFAMLLPNADSGQEEERTFQSQMAFRARSDSSPVPCPANPEASRDEIL